LPRQQARDFHSSLKVKIASQKIKSNTASKYIAHMRILIKTYKLAHDDENKTVFDGLNFKSENNANPPFSIDFLNDRWFKELCGLNPDQDIKLTAAVSHIIIQENQNRQLKTMAWALITATAIP